MEWYFVLLIALGAIAISAVVTAFVCAALQRKSDENALTSAKSQARMILEEARKSAESRKKEALLQIKEEILRDKNEAENEIRERRKEISRQEHRLVQKEENLDAKTEALERKNAALLEKEKEADRLRSEIEAQRDEEIRVLERLSLYSQEEAKEELLHRVEDLIAHETAMKISEYESRFREEADEKAKNLLSLAIQRCAADHVSEIAISVVSLPNEEIKGKIIGREGRNIRAIETLTGVELIIDDTPEVITISGFDPVRREIARIALEKLIADGRIHPARIEEMVEKAKKEVDNSIKQAGEKAVFETGVHGLQPELIRLLGRLKYRTSFGQNVLRHSVEVSLLAGNIASEMGVNPTIAKRAGLLHDIGKALTQEAEGSHIQLGVEVARKYRESKDIIHAIEAHHNDVEPTTVLDFIIQAADAISAARPGARREDMENYIKRLQKLEEIAGEFPGVKKTFAIQAGREVRVVVNPETVDDDKMKLLARDVAAKIESELEYPGQIKVNVIRESRVVEYAN